MIQHNRSKALPNGAPAFGLRALQRRFRFAPRPLRRPKSAGKPDALQTLRDLVAVLVQMLAHPSPGWRKQVSVLMMDPHL